MKIKKNPYERKYSSNMVTIKADYITQQEQFAKEYSSNMVTIKLDMVMVIFTLLSIHPIW